MIRYKQLVRELQMIEIRDKLGYIGMDKGMNAKIQSKSERKLET